MTTQIVVPNSLRSLVEENGNATRQFQLFMTAVKEHIEALERQQVPQGGMVLLAAGAAVPTGWTSGGTVTIGGTNYVLAVRS